MYTDTAVPRGIEIYLRSLGYRVSDGEVCWSEHGAQMDHATDFDISGDLIAQPETKLVLVGLSPVITGRAQELPEYHVLSTPI